MGLIKCKECKKEFSDKAVACPHCGAVFEETELKKMQDEAKNKVGGWTIFFVLLFVFYIIGKFSESSDRRTEVAPAATEEVAPAVEELAKDQLSLEGNNNQSYTEANGNIYMGSFKIRNNSDKDIKDIAIECTTFGKSGTEVDKVNTVIYDTIKAKSMRKFKGINMGFINSQSAKSSCEISNAVFN
jgi:hypothetical protein